MMTTESLRVAEGLWQRLLDVRHAMRSIEESADEDRRPGLGLNVNGVEMTLCQGGAGHKVCALTMLQWDRWRLIVLQGLQSDAAQLEQALRDELASALEGAELEAWALGLLHPPAAPIAPPEVQS